jgi:glycosyltransferase involved in cell wall biosynthesis
MRIAFSPTIFTAQKYGGISRYIVELIKGLRKDHGVDVCVPMLFFINSYYKDCHKWWQFDVSFCPKRSYKVFELINYYFQYVYFLFNKIDIYHITYYSSRLCAPKQAKKVMTVYDFIHERFSSSFSYDEVQSIQLQKKYLFDIVDGIISISNSTQSDLIEFYPNYKEKSEVIYLGFEPSKAINKNMRENKILFVGRRESYKNFNLLLQAFANVKDKLKNFELLCFSHMSFTEEENKLLRELKLEGKVELKSGDDDHLLKGYATARVFVYPSKYEGFGIPPLEAMSMGCPVISSNVSSIPEVVGEAGILIDPNSVEQLSEALLELCLNEKLQSELREKGYERLKSFTWSKCVLNHTEYYKNILK